MNVTERIKQIESDDRFGPVDILHELLKFTVERTGRGEIEDDYTKTINFSMGEFEISLDPYYQRAWLYQDDEEIELEEDEKMNLLIKELKIRLIQFEKDIKKLREKIVNNIFDKPFTVNLYKQR